MPNLEGRWRVPPRGRAAANDRGMLVLEQKLGILTQGPARTRRNPALDVLTGRVPDERLASLQANLGQLSMRAAAEPTTASDTAAAAPRPSTGPTAMVLPVAAIRMAAVARSTRPAPSPWLQPTHADQPRLRLISPPPSRWSRVPWIGAWLERYFAERRANSYSWTPPTPSARAA
jgi:hypothetical protein